MSIATDFCTYQEYAVTRRSEGFQVISRSLFDALKVEAEEEAGAREMYAALGVDSLPT